MASVKPIPELKAVLDVAIARGRYTPRGQKATRACVKLMSAGLLVLETVEPYTYFVPTREGEKVHDEWSAAR